MKRKKLLLWLLLGLSLEVTAQDFSLQNDDGLTLKYTVYNEEERIVEFKEVLNHNTQEPLERLNIPKEVVYNGTTYQVRILSFRDLRNYQIGTLVIPEYVTRLNSVFPSQTYNIERLEHNAINCVDGTDIWPHIQSKITVGAAVRQISEYTGGLPDGEVLLKADSIHFNAADMLPFRYMLKQDNIQSVTIGPDVVRIPEYLFYGLFRLQQVDIPQNVKEIGSDAFFPTVRLNGWLSTGPTVTLDRENCDWEKVYLYCHQENDYNPLREEIFPGTDCTDNRSFTFCLPTQYTTYIHWNDGTQDNMTSAIRISDESIHFKLKAQSGQDIACAMSPADGKIHIPADRFRIRLQERAAEEPAWRIRFKKSEAGNWSTATIRISNDQSEYPMTDTGDGYLEYTAAESSHTPPFSFTILDADKKEIRNLTAYNGTLLIELTDENSPTSDYNVLSYTPNCVLETDSITGYPCTKASIVCCNHKFWPSTWNTSDYTRNLHSWDVDGENDAWAFSPIIDPTGSRHLSLSFTFRIWKEGEAIANDYSEIFKLMVTTDDVNWQEVPILYPAKSGNSSLRQVVNLDQYANAPLRIAFRHICTEQEQTGVAVDDIEITNNSYEHSGITYQGMDLVSGPYPESAAHFYDIDQDGTMEYITDKGIYNNHGYELSFFKDGDTQEVVLIDDLNRDGKPEIIKKTGDDNLQIQRLDGTVIDQITCSFYNLVSLDANNDGRTDLFLAKEDALKLFYQKTDGTFIGQDIEIITDEEAINDALFAQYGENPIVQPPINFGGASLSKAPRWEMTGYDRVAEILAYKGPEAIDINMDGLPDLLNLYNGNALLSLGNSRYYYGSFGGSVTAKDLNGDGIPDFVVYNEKEKTVTLYLYEGNNSFKEQQLMQNFNITGVHCYDYDKDGDIDILLPFDYTESSQYSYLVFYENQGNNVFKKRERSTQQPFKFLECTDFDNDGLYEVLAYHPKLVREENTDQLYHEFYLLECQTGFDFVIEETPILSHKAPYRSESQPEILTGDFNADGRMEYFVQFEREVSLDYGFNGRVFRGEFKTGKPNTPPARMEAPTFLTDAASHTLRVEWKTGSDAETQPKDLTYALRIGTAPGKDDIWTGYANAAGTRLRTGAGNASSNLYQLINTRAWNKGDYYIAVQAVDPSGMAGPWSEETVFANNVLAVDYHISSSMITTADTLHIALNTPFRPDYQYAWDFGENSEIIQNTDTEWQVVYHQAGSKTMRLTITDEEGLTADKEEDLYVHPLSMREWTYKSENQTVEEKLYKGRFVDIDMDGNNDLIGTMQEDWHTLHGVFQNDGKGNFQKVGRTYNSDFEPSKLHRAKIIDYNMDGLPDFVVPSNKGNLFINEGDFDFTYSTEDLGTLYNNQGAVYMDFNNDGYKDFLLGTSLHINQGDNRTFQEISLRDFSPTLQDAIAVDIDRDGWIDIVGKGRLTDLQGEICILRNKGNLTFEVLPSFTIIRPEKYGSFSLYAADMNNDGYVDIIIAFEQELHIYWGDQNLAYTQHTDWKNEHPEDVFYYSDISLFDLDNNGYPDLYTSVRAFYFYPGPEIVVQDKHLGDYYDSGITYDLNGNGVPDTYYFEIQSRHTNTPPQTPANVRAVQAHDFVTLYWDPATDAETPTTQIRYNISLKKAGQSGENSYLLSPLNGTSDQASPIAEMHYPHSTQLSVPIDRFTAGETYELQVQAIDLWGAHSPFSKTYTFTVESMVGIEGPEQTCRYSEITLEYRGTETGTPVWKLDGGTLVHQEGNSVTAFWETTGTKTVSVEVNGQVSTRPIKVSESLELSFTLPEYVLAGAAIPFTLPEVFAEAGRTVGVRTSDQQDIQSSALTFTGKSPVPDTENKIQVERRGTTLDARVTFSEDCADEEGKVWIELYCIDPICGETAWRQEVTLAASNITPQITLVTADATTGKNKIIWKTPADLPEGLFRAMAIYKESGSTNNFVKIDEVPVDAEMYIDQQSDPTVRKNRYRIALATVYDSYSTQSETHSSVHVMLNKGMGNDINIVWTPYEGGTPEQYTILRGTSTEDMNLLTTASGYETSYTDKTAQEGVTYYYALAYSSLYQDNWIPMNAPDRSARANGEITGQSNLVCSSESNSVTFAESVTINTIEKEAELTPEQQTLHLYAEIMPAMASYKQVNWLVTEGEQLAQINSAGVLTYKGNGLNGTVQVQATTVDGTNLSVFAEIPVYGFTAPEIKVTTIEISAEQTILTPDNPSTQLHARVLPENATDQRIVWSLTEGADIAEISAEGVVTALGSNGTVTARATALDGSGIYGELTLQCTDFVAVRQTTNEDIHIYPVPARETLNITCPFEIRQILLISADGQQIQAYSGNLEQISVAHLPAGIYFLQISGTGNELETLRFIVAR